MHQEFVDTVEGKDIWARLTGGQLSPLPSDCLPSSLSVRLTRILRFRQTREGFDYQTGVNYLGHVELARILIEGLLLQQVVNCVPMHIICQAFLCPFQIALRLIKLKKVILSLASRSLHGLKQPSRSTAERNCPLNPEDP